MLSGADEERGVTKRTLVLGMGCILMRDDGVGPSALATFASLYELPAEVELLDIGTPGPELAHQIGGYDALIVFDALRVQSPPGTVRCLTRNEILDRVWGKNVVVDERTVDNFVSNLKKKLRWTPESPFNFKSVRGVGYRLERS